MKRYIRSSEEIKELTIEDYASVSDKEMTKLRDKYIDKMMDKLERNDPEYYSSAGNYTDKQTNLLKKENDKIREARKLNKESVNASTKLDEFMRYHEDPNNYPSNEDGFNKMYDILNEYGTENEDVDVVFKRATPEDQDKMIALIKPRPKFGSKEYARKLYYDALEGSIENASSDYCSGVEDAIEALFAGGWLDENEFRTDL